MIREQNSFVQSYGSKSLDASLLLIAMVGFLPPSDPRIRGTLAAIEKGLIRDGFVQRYHTSEGADGLPPGEGVFLACSFWLADNYILQGRLDEARNYSKGFCRCATTSAFWPRNTIPRAAAIGKFPASVLASCADQHGP